MEPATVLKLQNKIYNMDISEKHINNNSPILESFNQLENGRFLMIGIDRVTNELR